jgi:prepilin-type N-terminal cleavage/methylation domain-containing protein
MHKYVYTKKKKLAAFTLIELLVVIAIIGVLASVVLSSLNSARGKAKEARVVSTMKNMQSQLALFYEEHGSYVKGVNENIIGSVLLNGSDESVKLLQLNKNGNDFIYTFQAYFFEAYSNVVLNDLDIDTIYISPFSDPSFYKMLQKLINEDLAPVSLNEISHVYFGNSGQTYAITKTVKVNSEGHHIYCIDDKGNFKKSVRTNSGFNAAIEIEYLEDSDGRLLNQNVWCKN